MKYRVTDVRWDTDGEQIDLPTEFTVELELSEIVEDLLGDWLSDTVGFCHFGFEFEEIEVDTPAQ